MAVMLSVVETPGNKRKTTIFTTYYNVICYLLKKFNPNEL